VHIFALWTAGMYCWWPHSWHVRGVCAFVCADATPACTVITFAESYLEESVFDGTEESHI